MLKHIGIEPHWGKVSIYDPLNQEITTISLNYHCNYPNECNHLFKIINHSIGKVGIGQIVICCDGSDSNDFLKACIKAAKNNGYYSVHLISRDVAFYIQAVEQTMNHVFEKMMVCIIYVYGENGLCMQIWLVENQGAVLQHSFVTNQRESTDWEILKQKINETQKTLPIFIVETCLEKEFTNYFQINPKIFEYSFQFFSEAAVIKARINSNDKNVAAARNAQNTLGKDIILNIADEYIYEIPKAIELPFNESISVTLTNETENLCKVNEIFRETFTKVYSLPKNKAIDILFSINEDGIYSFTAENSLVKHSSQQIRTQPSLIRQASINNDTNIYLLPQPHSFYDCPQPIIGINFGTTECFASINSDEGGFDVIPLDPISPGNSLISFVSYSEEKIKCGEAAIYKIRDESSYTIFDFKRILGRNLSEVKVDILWRFELAEGENGVEIGVNTYSGKMWLTPNDVCSVIFKAIKDAAEKHPTTITNFKLTDAVITVSLSYNEEKINAIFNSAKAAGWDTVYIMLEPIAAILAYHFNYPIQDQNTILLFDLGGGHLNICIATILGSYLQVLSTGFDDNLGGRDFDGLLLNYFTTILLTKYQIEVMASERKKFKLMEKCQRIKHNLSLRMEDKLEVDDFNSNIDADIEIKRNIFEIISSELLSRIKTTIINTLLEANLDPNQIQQILKIGGASKMPMITILLQTIFPNSDIISLNDSEKLVSNGASLYGCMLKGVSHKPSFY